MIAFLVALALQEETLAELFKSLSDAHREACLKSYDDADRDAENFTPGKRPGLLIKDLNDEQFRLLERAIKLFLSETGYAQAMQVAEQSHKNENWRAYYLNFYGDPTKDKDWAFRVSEHHLTLVHVNSDPARFGPILLGANPPKIWQEQEDAAIECFKKLSDDDKKKAVVEGRATSGRKLGERGVPIDELSKDAQAAALAMIEIRLKLFSEPQQKKLRAILETQGKLRLAFFGEMTQRSADGGKADWKIEGPSFLCDYESSRGHIHMTLRGRWDPKSKLVGRWVIDPEDKEGIRNFGQVEMEFTEDGRLIYSIEAGTINLTYRIERDLIVSNQPSHPKEERTAYSFANDKLVLKINGEESRYIRKK